MRLCWGKLHVADLSEVHEHQGTWFGTYRLVVTPTDGEGAKRVLEFVAFNIDWNERCEGPEAPSTDEFDQFSDVVNGAWWAAANAGERKPIKDAPNFLAEDEVSWLLEERGDP